VFGILFFANILVWYVVFTEEGGGKLVVAFLDVGQGDSIFIQAPNGSQVLVDGGPNKSVLRELGKMMPFHDRSINMVIATHPDADHVGGLLPLLERFDVGAVLEPGVASDSSVYSIFESMVVEEGSEHILARSGMNIVLDEGIYLEILFPDRSVAGLGTNDASIVAKLVYGETSFLFTGDSPQKIEKYLVSLDRENLDIDILKLGHHGSRTSTHKSFLEATTPEIAIVSAEKDSRYGHPHKEVMDLLAEFGIPAISTADRGTIVFESDGESVYIK